MDDCPIELTLQFIYGISMDFPVGHVWLRESSSAVLDGTVPVFTKDMETIPALIPTVKAYAVQIGNSYDFL